MGNVKRPSRKGKLTERQQLFVTEYLVDFDAGSACVRAGYECANRNVACASGAKLLTKPLVAAAIKDAIANRVERVEVKADEVLREISRIALADLRKAYNEDGSLKPVNEWPDEVAAFVSSIEIEELWSGRGDEREQSGVLQKIKLWPKMDALKLLMQHLGLLTSKLEVTGKGGGPIQVEEQSIVIGGKEIKLR